MKRLNLSVFILSAAFSSLGAASFAFAQEDEAVAASELSETLPMPEASPPAPEVEEPAGDRPYDAPLNDDPVDGKDDSWSTPPNETGPAVDDHYNAADEGGSGLWSLLRVGPTVQLGFPHPITYGLDAIFADVVSVGFSTGKYDVTQIDKADIEIKSWDVHARWHPFAGSFFLGGMYGKQDIKGRFEDDVSLTLSGFPATVPVRVDARIKSNYFTPHIGWLAVYDSGFTMGFEIGAQIPLSPDTSVEARIPGAVPAEEAQVKQTSDFKDLKKQADDTVKIFGKRTIPYITLLKLGWLF